MTMVLDLSRNAAGRLVLDPPGGGEMEVVVPVRPFPISAPDEGIALVDSHGRERAWIDRLEDLAEPARTLVADELASREFTPEITGIDSVSGFATPSTWQVRTDRGVTSLVLKGEEDIRRLGQNALLISDNHGIQYLVRDLTSLDRKSRKLLDRFL